MMTIETLTTFLGWCTAINIGLLLFSSLFIMLMRGTTTKIHSAMFGLPASDLPMEYFRYLGTFKIAIIVLNLVPYLVLRLMM